MDSVSAVIQSIDAVELLSARAKSYDRPKRIEVRQKQMVNRRSWEHYVLPGVLMVAGLVLMAISFVLTTTRTMSQSGMWMDQMPSTVTAYTVTNLVLAIMGAIMFTSGLMYLFLREEYEPLQPSTIPTVPPTISPIPTGMPGRAATEPGVQSNSHMQSDPREQNDTTVADHPATATVAAESPQEDERRPAHYLILRLLTGDERAMFRAVMDSGGEALQKDLILKTKMSDAKVSRVIDRLEEKGVVSRKRFGMTNKVSIEVDS